MKKLMLILLVVVAITSCEKDEPLTTSKGSIPTVTVDDSTHINPNLLGDWLCYDSYKGVDGAYMSIAANGITNVGISFMRDKTKDDPYMMKGDTLYRINDIYNDSILVPTAILTYISNEIWVYNCYCVFSFKDYDYDYNNIVSVSIETELWYKFKK